MMAMEPTKRVLRETADPRYRRGAQTARDGRALQSRHANGQPGPLRGRVSPPVRIRLGRASSAMSPKPIAGPTAPTAASGRVRQRCRCLPGCIGIRGSARRPTGIITPTCIRTNGMAGMISATAPSATWVAMCWKAFSGRSRPNTRPASRRRYSRRQQRALSDWRAPAMGHSRARRHAAAEGLLV